MTTDWMLDVDRKDAISAFERLLHEGGCLALCGDPNAGHHSLARHLSAKAENAGHTVLRCSRAGIPTPPKRVLLDLWERVSPPPAKNVVPRWNAPGPKLPLAEIVDATSTALQAFRNDVEDVVLVIETPDQFDRYARDEALAYPRIAARSGCPVLVTSISTPRDRWDSLEGCEAIELCDFTEHDILEVMIAQPFVKGSHLKDVVEARDTIMDGRADIPPDDAYALLRAWGDEQ